MTLVANGHDPILLTAGASRGTSVPRRTRRRRPSSGSPTEVGPGSAAVEIDPHVADKVEEVEEEVLELADEGSVFEGLRLAGPLGLPSPGPGGGPSGGLGGGRPPEPPLPPPLEQSIASTQPILIQNGSLHT